MKTVAVLLPDGAFLSGFGAIADILALANHYVTRQYGGQETTGRTVELTLLGMAGAVCRAAEGVAIQTGGTISGRRSYDAIYLAPFVFESEARLARYLTENEPVCQWLREQYAGGAMLAAMGSAVTLVAHAGLIGPGGHIGAPWWLEAVIRRRFPQIEVERVNTIAETGRILTTGSMQASVPLALRLVERLLSRNVADWIAKIGMIRPAAEAGEEVPSAPRILHEDPLIAKAQHWLQLRFTQKPRMSELASALAVSERTLIRHFGKTLGMTPLGYLQTLRIEAAKLMLAHTDRQIERIAYLVGYSDAKFFKKVFRDQTGLAPSTFRREARETASQVSTAVGGSAASARS